VLHQAGEVEELIPVELDLERAAQARRRGFKGLGQTLKSFRDRRVEFDLYKSRAFGADYLASLGPLEKSPAKRTTIIHPAAATVG
jgi:hypothetical protein